MKYAIYDKAADAYLTTMEFEVGYSEHTQFECGLNEYITEAKLLDTPKEAADAIVRIESFKFMEKGRFVVHSFDDTLNDQYIISEAGNPTKVVDNITVDLEGTIDIKYGTMMTHWSTMSLYRVITRMNALQKAVSEIYTPWDDTFDIYKVITIMDEKEHTHCQFINVTSDLKRRVEEAEKSLNNQLELNHGVCNENRKLRIERDCTANIIYAIRNAICNNDSDAFRCINSRMIHDPDFKSDPFMAGVRENVKDICTAEKKNIANNDLKNSEIARLTDERDKALERAEKFKGIANSVYGMTIPSRCNGKQMFCDIATGKKILIDKKKYDELVEWIDAINMTYDTQFFMNKPAYLPIMIEHLNNLTK